MTRGILGPKRPKKQHGLAFKVFWRTLAGLASLVLLGIIALVVVYLRTPIPQPQANVDKQVSVVYYSDGKSELGRFSTVNREDVKLSQVPKTVRYEFLSAEDRNFYKNSGVSISGTARAAWVTLTGGAEQGGSTITQQYVKNYFLTQDRSVKRKTKEIMIALKIDRKYSKDQILEDYLNTIYFGRGAYGIQAASQAYFGVDVSKLNASQGAFLASVINAPSLYDPYYGSAASQRANARMVYVLDGMVKEGWMTQAQRDQQKFPQFKKYNPQASQVSGPNGYIVAAVRSELLNKRKLSAEDIDRGGLRITTTISKKAQAAAVSAVDGNVSAATVKKDKLHTGLIALQPDGAVSAMYGGTNITKSAVNSATQAKLQGGSSFKTFGLAAALQDGMTMQTRFSGASPLKLAGSSKTVSNDQNEQFGDLTLERAYAVSSNTAFVRLNQKLGTGKTLAAAVQLGIPSSDPGMKDPVTTDILGSAAVSVRDMATAFNTISAQGKKADPYLIEKISSTVGDYSYSADPKTEQAIKKQIAANLANGMTGPIADSDGTAHAEVGDFSRPAAGKTGTSSGFKSAWFTGFTPNQLTASVGMYAGDGTVSLAKATGDSEFYGGAIPAAIWKDFMTAALKGEDVAKLPKATDTAATAASSSASSTSSPSPTSSETPSSTESSTSSESPSSTSSTSSSTQSSTTTSTEPSTTEPTTTEPTTTEPTTTRPTTTQPSATRPTTAETPPAASGAADDGQAAENGAVASGTG